MENMEKMEVTPEESQNVRPEITSESENFDAKGNPRKNREMPDGTFALLSDQEYAEEIQNQRD